MDLVFWEDTFLLGMDLKVQVDRLKYVLRVITCALKFTTIHFSFTGREMRAVESRKRDRQVRESDGDEFSSWSEEKTEKLTRLLTGREISAVTATAKDTETVAAKVTPLRVPVAIRASPVSQDTLAFQQWESGSGTRLEKLKQVLRDVDLLVTKELIGISKVNLFSWLRVARANAIVCSVEFGKEDVDVPNMYPFELDVELTIRRRGADDSARLIKVQVEQCTTGILFNGVERNLIQTLVADFFAKETPPCVRQKMWAEGATPASKEVFRVRGARVEATGTSHMTIEVTVWMPQYFATYAHIL